MEILEVSRGNYFVRRHAISDFNRVIGNMQDTKNILDLNTRIFSYFARERTTILTVYEVKNQNWDSNRSQNFLYDVMERKFDHFTNRIVHCREGFR